MDSFCWGNFLLCLNNIKTALWQGNVLIYAYHATRDCKRKPDTKTSGKSRRIAKTVRHRILHIRRQKSYV